LAKTRVIVRFVTLEVKQLLIVTKLDNIVSVQVVLVNEVDVSDRLPKVTAVGNVMAMFPPVGIGSARVQSIV